jgi:NADPH:quinone reductase-like Zn-dependent oxidoreductase
MPVPGEKPGERSGDAEGGAVRGYGAVRRNGVKAEGNAAGASASVLAELAGLIAAGQLEVPIAAVFPLDEVREAYQRLARGHIRGKIVLVP